MKNYSGKIKSSNKTNKIKIILNLIFILSIVFSAMGCSSSARKDTSDLGNYKSDVPMEAYDDAYDYEYEYGYDGLAEERAAEPQANSPGIGTKEAEPNQRKLIKNGNVELRCEDVEESYQNVLDLVEKYEGFATNLNRSETDARLQITADFGVPADNLDQFIEEISETEIVNYLKINAEDITDAYYDATIRLDTAEKSLEKYYEFLLDAKKIEDMVYIQGEIDYLTEEIELLKGSIKRWDSQVDYSYVSIEFLQKQAPLSGKREIEFSAMTWDDFKYWVSSGWNSVLSTVVSFFQWLAIGILVSAPIIIPLLLILFILLAIYRKRKKAKKQKQEAEAMAFMTNNPQTVAYDQSFPQDKYIENQQFLNQNSDQTLNQNSDQILNQNSDQTMNQNNDQILNQNSDQTMNQEFEQKENQNK
ncbi:MAG: DUF4349 domain-containing protein [Clostridiaceae bacterium]|nr:DUF4349 domain-containing protein [Clostridiaceae bacterium]